MKLNLIVIRYNMSKYISQSSIEQVPNYDSYSETDTTKAPSISSVLSDNFLEENEIHDFYLSLVKSNSSECFVQFNFPTSVDQHYSTPAPQLNTTSIPSQAIDIPTQVRNILIMSKLVKCCEFSGYPQDNAKGFLSKFESYALLQDLFETDKRRIAGFHLHLKGPVRTWFNSLSDESIESWTTLCVLFKEKYINFSWQSATVIMEIEIFQNMVLAPGQSMEGHFSQLSEKAQILRKHEHELVAKFISGMPDSMAFFVRAGHPVDAQQALTSAKMEDTCGYRQHGDSVNVLRNDNRRKFQQTPDYS